VNIAKMAVIFVCLMTWWLDGTWQHCRAARQNGSCKKRQITSKSPRKEFCSVLSVGRTNALNCSTADLEKQVPETKTPTSVANFRQWTGVFLLIRLLLFNFL
jgi:hypothetical protein